MKSDVKARTAAEQCLEYVIQQRVKQRRDQAQKEIEAHTALMIQRYGVTHTLGALFRHVGWLIADGSAGSEMIRAGRRYLAKKIAQSLLRGLTGRPMRH